MTTPFDPSTTPGPNDNLTTSQVLPPTLQESSSSPQQTQPFPDSQVFTIIPQLYTLISRLAPLQNANSHAQQSGATSTAARSSRSPTLTRKTPAAPADQPHQQQQQQQQSTDTTSAPLGLTRTRSREEAIEVKDLPALVYPLRQQIERAKEVVRALPDVQRGISEQEREIAELEARIVGLRGRVVELAGLAGGGRGDVVMTGVEG